MVTRECAWTLEMEKGCAAQVNKHLIQGRLPRGGPE